MKKFNFPLERMLNYQEQDLEKERGIMSRLLAARTGLEEKRLRLMEEMEEIQSERGKEIRKGTTIFSLRSSSVLLVSGKKQLEEYRHAEAKEEQEMISEHVSGSFVRNGVSYI